MMKRLFLLLALAMTGCGGAGLGIGTTSGSTTAGSSGNASSGGYWTGTLGDDSVFAVIDENGLGAIVDTSNGVIYHVNASTTNGTQLNTAIRAYAQSGKFLPDGATAEAGTLSASIVERSSLSGTVMVAGTTTSIALDYNASRYEIASSFASLSGSFPLVVDRESNSYTVTFSFGGSATFSATDTNGCSYTGSIGVPAPAYDAFTLEFLQTCGGVTTSLSGVANLVPASNGASATLTLEYDDANDFATQGIATAQ